MTINGNVTINGDNIEAGGQKTVNYYIRNIEQFHTHDAEQKMQLEDNPVMALFDKLTRDAIAQHPNDWKEILKPYKSAIDAGAMDRSYSREQFNAMFGVEVPATPFSRWVGGNDEKYQYKEQDNSSMIGRFEVLKNQKSGK